jgi:cytochrome c oxidase subunit II
MSTNRRHLVIVGSLVVIVTVLVNLLLESVLQWPVQGSAEAVITDNLFSLHILLISFLFALIMVFMLYSMVVFRRKRGDDSDGEYTHGNTRLEVIWTVVPLIVVIYFGVLGTTTLREITAPDPDELVVEVTGFQWAWRYDYPDLDVTTTELIVPVDRRIRLDMTATDVIHSFWVPELRVKQDLVPGMVTQLRFTPTQEGVYQVRCAEMCGLSHAYMLSPIRILSQDEYQAWVTENTAAAD